MRRTHRPERARAPSLPPSLPLSLSNRLLTRELLERRASALSARRHASSLRARSRISRRGYIVRQRANAELPRVHTPVSRAATWPKSAAAFPIGLRPDYNVTDAASARRRAVAASRRAQAGSSAYSQCTAERPHLPPPGPEKPQPSRSTSLRKALTARLRETSRGVGVPGQVFGPVGGP